MSTEIPEKTATKEPLKQKIVGLLKTRKVLMGIFWASLVQWSMALGAIAFFQFTGDGSESIENSATDSTQAELSRGSADPKEIEGPISVSAGFTVAPEDLKAHARLMEMFLATGESDKAIPHMERLMPKHRGNPEFLVKAAEMYLGAARFSRAWETAQNCLALAPGNSKAQAVAVTAEYRQGRVDEALKNIRLALDKNPENPDLLMALGIMEAELGLPSPGALEKLLRIRPDFPPALYQLGRKNQLEGNFLDALVRFKRLVEVEPDNAKARGQLGIVHYHLGETPQAQQQFEKALALNPTDFNTWYNLGELWLSKTYQGKSPTDHRQFRHEAMACYLKAVELYPPHGPAHYRIGVLMNGNGQYKEAIRYLQHALERDPSSVSALIQLSLAYERLELYDDAREQLLKAFDIDPLNTTVIFKLRKLSEKGIS